MRGDKVLLFGYTVKCGKRCSGAHGAHQDHLCTTALPGGAASGLITHFRTLRKSKIPLKYKGIEFIVCIDREKSELVLCFYVLFGKFSNVGKAVTFGSYLKLRVLFCFRLIFIGHLREYGLIFGERKTERIQCGN